MKDEESTLGAIETRQKRLAYQSILVIINMASL